VVNPTYYGGDLRRDLLEEALGLIAAEGPSAVSLRSLARRLGVSHAAPANHFPDKAALFTAIAVEGFELLAAAIEDAARRAGPDATAAQRFGAAGRAYAGFALGHPAHFAVMWQRDLLHRDDPALVAAGDATFALLLGGVREIQAAGGAPGADPEVVAYLAWSTVHGLAALWLGGPLQQTGRPFDQLADEVATLLGRAFAVPPPPTPPEPTAPAGSATPPGPTAAPGGTAQPM
jgi:AcrR family transcriptional regulator